MFSRSLGGGRSKGKGYGIRARDHARGRREEGGGRREVEGGKREEGGGRREEGRGKREEGPGRREPLFSPSRLLIKKITKITQM